MTRSCKIFQKRIEVVVSDSAANETRACEEGRGRQEAATGNATLVHPNLIVRVRDGAHASR
eukprot:11267014-Prorocentrum_lima.AAC.1